MSDETGSRNWFQKWLRGAEALATDQKIRRPRGKVFVMLYEVAAEVTASDLIMKPVRGTGFKNG
jgi:hypothetical protein